MIGSSLRVGNSLRMKIKCQSLDIQEKPLTLIIYKIKGYRRFLRLFQRQIVLKQCVDAAFCSDKTLIVSITKFSIVIGSPRAYLSRNRRAITWVSNYSCLIWTFSNWTAVIGYPRDFHVNYARFNGFLSNVYYSFRNLG